ncbi:hypothetical protein MBAV_003437 [Candidatus Magnetobacterium bavaricum]|uniref:Uncharacterized protein n=1 Tax=Candidatus Magnetobacterium bavaricum TaxID=29290 RepID=A0A0F3GQY8_9BACT|nr:hypothetical protein MBAV_003437 [Candidatus Magnetobacterium bavaricum]
MTDIVRLKIIVICSDTTNVDCKFTVKSLIGMSEPAQICHGFGMALALSPPCACNTYLIPYLLVIDLYVPYAGLSCLITMQAANPALRPPPMISGLNHIKWSLARINYDF